MMKNIATIIFLISLVGGTAMPSGASAPSNTSMKQKMSTYNASGVTFSYPASWGTLSDRSAEIIEDSDGQKAFGLNYLKTMLPLRSSSSAIKEVFFHKPTKMLAYVESQGNKDVLYVKKSNGSPVKLSSVGNDIDNLDTYRQFGDLNISPRGHLLFVVETPWGKGGGGPVSIYDLRTLKHAALAANPIGFFSPANGIFFSNDASRMAILASDPDSDGEESLYIQDPKTLHMKEIYRIHLVEYNNAREKYGEDAYVRLTDIAFDGKGRLSFTKAMSKDLEGIKRVEIQRSTYDFSGKGKLVTSKVQMVK